MTHVQPIPIPCLRGVNVSSHSKGMPFNPVDPYTSNRYLSPSSVFEPFGTHSISTGLDCISSLGFNCIRLLIFLEACFTSSGGLVDSYIDGVGDFILAARSRGLFVVLDFHQDNYSRRLGGSGLADAFLPTSLRTVHTSFKGLGESWGSQPLIDKRYWICWTRFWDNVLVDEMTGWPRVPLQDLYVYCLTTILKKLYKRDGLFIDAIDIINEPCLPEVFAGKFIFSPGQLKTRRKQLIDFYIHAIIDLEKIGFKGYYFLEPFNYDVSYLLRFSIGLNACCRKVCEAIPGLNRERLIFAPHLYQPLKRLGPSIDYIVRNHLKAQRDGGFSWMIIGELGDITYGSPEGEVILDKQLKRLFEMGIPWIIWEFCPVYEASEAESRDMYRLISNVHCFPWNGEYCSIIGPRLQPLPIYINVVSQYLLDSQTVTTASTYQHKVLRIFFRKGFNGISYHKLKHLTHLSGQSILIWPNITWYAITSSKDIPSNAQTRQYLSEFAFNILGFHTYLDAVKFATQHRSILICSDESLLKDEHICDLLAE